MNVATSKTIRSYSTDEYLDKVRKFHGYTAPGVIIGGFMVDLAYQHLPKEGLFDAICETEKCLADSIQLLTPCTVGNSWLRVFDTGRFALTIYDKISGEGVRVYVDPVKLEKWSEINTFFFKLKPKKEQDSDLLLRQILEAGTDILSWEPVKVDLSALKKPSRDKFVICPQCKEPYPASYGETCPGCRGKLPYKTKS